MNLQFLEKFKVCFSFCESFVKRSVASQWLEIDFLRTVNVGVCGGIIREDVLI